MFIALDITEDNHSEFHKGCYQKHTNPLNCRTSSSDISGYHVDFHEGQGTVGELHRCGTARVNECGTAWQGNGMACVN
jgi:hypothetical protein